MARCDGQINNTATSLLLERHPNDRHDQAPSMELEHAIGYSCLPGGLFYHPDGKHLVYAAGGTVIVCDPNDPHAQHILIGHDEMITCLALGSSGRWVREEEQVE